MTLVLLGNAATLFMVNIPLKSLVVFHKAPSIANYTHWPYCTTWGHTACHLLLRSVEVVFMPQHHQQHITQMVTYLCISPTAMYIQQSDVIPYTMSYVINTKLNSSVAIYVLTHGTLSHLSCTRIISYSALVFEGWCTTFLFKNPQRYSVGFRSGDLATSVLWHLYLRMQ